MASSSPAPLLPGERVHRVRDIERTGHNLVLILAREFASKLATPMFVTDAEGNLVFFNEPAERIIGRAYGEVGVITAEEWAGLGSAEELDGTPIPPDARPVAVARRELRPVHQTMAVARGDGTRRQISVTAFPLLTRATELVGAVAIFWEAGADRAG